MSFPPPTEKQARILWMSMTALSLGILVALIGILAWGLGQVVSFMAPVIWPLAIAGILAYLLDPVVDFFERRRVPRGRAILLVFVLCIVCVLGLLGSVVPRLVYETRNLIEQVPGYTHRLQEDLSRWMSRKPYLFDLRERFFGPKETAPTNAAPAESKGQTTAQPSATERAPGAAAHPPEWAMEASTKLLQWLGQVLPKVGSWLLTQLSKVASWAGMIIGLAMVPVFTFYFLLEKHAIVARWTHYLPVQESKLKEELVFVLSAINDYLIAFFRGQVLVAMCNGVMLTIGFLIIGLNYAVLVGLIGGVLSIVPYLGTVLTIIPAMLLAVVEFQDWLHPLLVVAVYAAANAIEGTFISPKIMGDRVGLHPLTVIVALLVGTTLAGGILGGILAIPLTAALRVIMFRYVWVKPEEASPRSPADPQETAPK